ncbi:MAG: hypothetical protein V4568_15985 [Pseudomonadota bacterium]
MLATVANLLLIETLTPELAPAPPVRIALEAEATQMRLMPEASRKASTVPTTDPLPVVAVVQTQEIVDIAVGQRRVAAVDTVADPIPEAVYPAQEAATIVAEAIPAWATAADLISQDKQADLALVPAVQLTPQQRSVKWTSTETVWLLGMNFLVTKADSISHASLSSTIS